MEDERRKREGNLFYIPTDPKRGKSAAVSASDLDKIPVKELSTDDLSGNSVKVSDRRKGGGGRNDLEDDAPAGPAKTYVIASEEAMPKGMKADPKASKNAAFLSRASERTLSQPITSIEPVKPLLAW